MLNGNLITDISAVSGLTSLTRLSLSANSITDISALSGLAVLESLGLQSNSINDIGVLSGVTALNWLNVGFNSITDISALSGLTNLEHLRLHNNTNLSNIQPLIDNTGLSGAADFVDLKSTNVSCTDVAVLKAKLVTVASDCL